MYYSVKADLVDHTFDSAQSVIQQAVDKFGCCGVEDFSLDEAEIDQLLGERSYCGGELPEDVLATLDEYSLDNKIKTFFFVREQEALIFNDFLNHLSIVGQLSANDSQDWNSEWKKHFKRIDISERLAIYPDWDTNFQHEYSLRIHPGMGFGTGNHETTFLCLKLMEKYDLKKHTNCFDFGCGSGILGLAHAISNPAVQDIVMFDIDQDALDNCLVNLKLNQMKENKFNITKNLSLNKRYDFVFANILLSTLKEQKENILQICSTGTDIIFSGLLNNQESEFLQYYSEFEMIETAKKGDWIAIYMKKK
jgi:ribosomal protein L11 methyltransferase